LYDYIPNLNKYILTINKNYKNNKFSNSKYIKYKELRVMCKEIAILLESGCEIIKLLNMVKEHSSKTAKDALAHISDQIQRGKTLTQAFQSTQSFSNFFINKKLSTYFC